MIEVIKNEVMSFMAKYKLDVGHVLPTRPFAAHVQREFNPHQRDLLSSALQSLIDEGYLENKNNSICLTLLGYERIYPESNSDVLQWVRNDILGTFCHFNIRVGEMLPARPYWHNNVSGYTPPQKKVIDEALSCLISEGFVDAKKNNYILTQAGFDFIYK